MLIANPLPAVIRYGQGNARDPRAAARITKAPYLESLKMMYELFSMARKAGMAKLEEDIDNPEKSAVFSKYPKFVKSHDALHFLCDTLRTAAAGGLDPMDIDAMMETDLEVHQREGHEPITALSSMADSLPGLGIVAAVLGVVITMGSLGGPKEEIGERVAAALVGTFLGILLCYGVFGPLAVRHGQKARSRRAYFGFLRLGVLGLARA